jgi:hypothetical protein
MVIASTSSSGNLILTTLELSRLLLRLNTSIQRGPRRVICGFEVSITLTPFGEAMRPTIRSIFSPLLLSLVTARVRSKGIDGGAIPDRVRRGMLILQANAFLKNGTIMMAVDEVMIEILMIRTEKLVVKGILPPRVVLTSAIAK